MIHSSTDSTPQPKPRRRRIVILVCLVLILAALVGGAIYSAYLPVKKQTHAGGRHGGGAMSGDNSAMPVDVATATKGDMLVTQRELGTVTPLATITVRTQISGQLTEVAFHEGQMVQKGDFLAQIDPRPYEMQHAQYEGALQRDQALLKEAELNLDRYRKLVKQDSVSQQQLDSQESLAGQYRGDVQTDQAQIDQASLNLIYCHISAPISGLVGLRNVDAGNYVQTSDTNGLVTLTQTQPISVLFTVPEDDLPRIMAKLKAGDELPVTAYDRTQSTQLAVGKLVSTDSQIDTSTGTLKLRAQFDNADQALFPNQFVNVALQTDVLHDAISIPSSAVLRGEPGTFVYLVKDDKTVAVQVIKTGPVDGDRISITDGLKEGDVVVTSGTDKLRDGSHVTIPTATAAPQTGQ